MPDQDKTQGIAPSAFEPLSAQTPTTVERTHPTRWILIGAGLVFAVIMLFLLSARSLEIRVVAESAFDVSIKGGLVVPFGERYLMRQGDYEVTVEAPGYHTLTSSVTVADGDSQVLEIVLLPLPGLVTLHSQPPGATITIDGEPRGTTPVEDLSVAAGEHQLQIQADRYLPVSQPLSVTGRNIQQQLDLALAPAWADVTIASNPAGADIIVDGEHLGTSPAVVEIIQGERLLTLQKPGFADWQQVLTISPGEAQDLGTAALVPAAGIVRLASLPAGANVTINGEFEGQTPLDIELSPDREHRISVFKPGYRRNTSTIQLAAGENVERNITLVAQLGKVTFNISPADAILRIDGRPRGKGSQTLSLPAFEQSIEVSLAGHATIRKRITPRTGLAQSVTISLKTERESKLARIKPEITTALGQTLLLFDPAKSNGSFTMGASRREPGRRANEVLHPVALTRMFYLQSTEVTNAQFRLFVANHNSGQIEGNSLNREHQPVVAISWQQAAQFCNWLSAREGLPPFYKQTNGIVTGYNAESVGYRLPSEAEWAWAARVEGTQTLKFPWGDSFPPTTAVENYADNTSAYVTGRILNGYNDGHVVSATVASYSPNAKQLYDLGGNVAEWVHDVYAIPPANGTTLTDPLGAQSGDNYVVRGASWTQSKISELRLSHRDYGQAGRDDVGFRLARYAE